MLLARRFAGAAGRGQRAVQIEWDAVDELNPWRFGLATALGEPVPDPLLQSALQAPDGAYYARAGALLPMLPASRRAPFAGRAAREGILSSQALIDLYSAVYAEPAADARDCGPRSDLARSLSCCRPGCARRGNAASCGTRARRFGGLGTVMARACSPLMRRPAFQWTPPMRMLLAVWSWRC